MRKLSLKPEELRVESFATLARAVAAPGTVVAHAATRKNDLTCGVTCDADPLCIVTNDPTCMEPCGTTLCPPTETEGMEFCQSVNLCQLSVDVC